MFGSIGNFIDRYTTPSLHEMVADDAAKTKARILEEAEGFAALEGSDFDGDDHPDVVELSQATLPGRDGVLYTGKVRFHQGEVSEGWLIKTNHSGVSEEFRISHRSNGGTDLEYSELKTVDSYAGAKSKLYYQAPDGKVLINLPTAGIRPGPRD